MAFHRFFVEGGVLGALLLAACSNSGLTPVPANQSGLPKLGAIAQMNATSTAPDSDGDFIKDDVELILGTDPQMRDTDRDGLMDNAEVFGTDGFSEDAFVPDDNNDGIISARDSDDNSDDVNDGFTVDTDKDGIPNYLEYYGFTYDWLTESLMLWNGDPSVPHYRTDPLQPSTDQDPYSDLAEATGAFMDVLVNEPGDSPLVPASPNIVVRLAGYAVTLNESITYTQGGSLAKGTTWDRETTTTDSQTNESNWSTGLEMGVSGGDFLAVASFEYGESYATTNETSTAVSTGTSVLSESNWSQAISTNPTDAARLKLLLKVENHGTAPVSNVVPTVTLRIGGINVATFEPGNSQINLIIPGGTYPEQKGVYWVVDSVDTGVSIVPLSLTMSELRALESGAPVSIAMTQLSADVMLLDDAGTWQSAGDSNQYVARCDAVCALTWFDLGEGSTVQHLVYADDAPSAPPSTLRDALGLVGVGDDQVLHYVDKEGFPRSRSLEDFTFVFDPDTLLSNGYDLDAGGRPDPDFGQEDLILNPHTVLLVKAPRDPGDTGPRIHFAYYDRDRNEVRASASDYQGIRSVLLTDGDATVATPMTEELPGSGFYTGRPEISADAEADIHLTVVVENIVGEIAEQDAGVLFVYNGPWAPDINITKLDFANHALYANASSSAPDDPLSDIEWVRAFHPALPGGFQEMTAVINAYEDPHGYSCTLPVEFMSTGVKVVAYVAPGVYTEEIITSAVEAHQQGSFKMSGTIDTTGAAEEWRVPAINLDTAATERYFFEADDWTSSWNPPLDAQARADAIADLTHPLFPIPPYYPWKSLGYDFWLRLRNGSHDPYLTFNAAYARVPAGVTFDSLTRDHIINYAPSDTTPLKVFSDILTGDILAIKTVDGRYAKVQVSATRKGEDSWTNYYWCNTTVRYVVFKHPAANAGPDQPVLFDPSVTKIDLNGSASSGANSYAWSFVTKPGPSAGAPPTLTDPTKVTTSFVPDYAGDHILRLTINAGSSDEATDEVTVRVTLPVANAGADTQFELIAQNARVTLNGSSSTGVKTYTWTVTDPDGGAVSLKDPTTATPSFIPAKAGNYVVKLEINKTEGAPYADDTTVTLTVEFE
jgi:hypothetical protein